MTTWQRLQIPSHAHPNFASRHPLVIAEASIVIPDEVKAMLPTTKFNTETLCVKKEPRSEERGSSY